MHQASLSWCAHFIATDLHAYLIVSDLHAGWTDMDALLTPYLFQVRTGFSGCHLPSHAVQQV